MVAGYGGSEACMAPFKQLLTLLDGDGFRGSRSGSLQAVLNFARCYVVRVTEGLDLALFKQFLTFQGDASYRRSRTGTLQAVFNFARWCRLQRIWCRHSLSSFELC